MIHKIIGTLILTDGIASLFLGHNDDSTLTNTYPWIKTLLQLGRAARAILGAVLILT